MVTGERPDSLCQRSVLAIISTVSSDTSYLALTLPGRCGEIPSILPQSVVTFPSSLKCSFSCYLFIYALCFHLLFFFFLQCHNDLSGALGIPCTQAGLKPVKPLLRFPSPVMCSFSSVFVDLCTLRFFLFCNARNFFYLRAGHLSWK